MLHLSTRWGFASLRRLALKSINPPTPFDQLLLARAYSVDDWVSPALTALCERTVPLSLSEARQMTIEDVMLITTVREGIRPHALQVDPGEIPNCIEAVQIGMHTGGAGPGAPAPSLSLSSSSSSSLSLDGETPTSPSGSTTVSNNGTGQSARLTMAAGANDAGEKVGSGDGGENGEGEGEEEEEDAKTAVALSPVDGFVRRRANSNLKGEGEEIGPGENGSVRFAEKSSRPTSSTSAWGKILIVPSPTLSHAPHSPQAWGLPDDADEPPHGSSGWRRAQARKALRKSAARRSSPPPLPPKPFGPLQDSDGDGD